MKFSIIIPAYKAIFLKQAVDSVLAQTYQDWELIVVDDCSPEGLDKILTAYSDHPQVRFYRNEQNIGSERLTDNWNRCLSYCSGDYVICMGDDDMLVPTCLEDYVALMDRFPGLGVYHAMTTVIDEKGDIVDLQERRPEWESSLSLLWHRWKGRDQYIGDFCFDAKVLRANGGFFSLPLAWGADDITAYLAAKSGEDGIANTQRPGFLYRNSPYTITESPRGILKMRAMKLAQEWFRKELSSRKPVWPEDELYLRLLPSQASRYYAECLKVYICNDIAARPAEIFRWLKSRKEFSVSGKDIVLSFMRGFKKRKRI